MKVEREFGQDRKPRGSIIAERWYYDDTYLRDDKGPDSTGECALFMRRYRLIKTVKGNFRIKERRVVENFPDDDAILAAVEERHMAELPVGEQEEWVPPELIAILSGVPTDEVDA